MWSVAALGQTSAPLLQKERDSKPAAALLPEAPHVSLTAGQKFTGFITQMYTPWTFTTAGLSGGWGQMTGSPPEYGGGMEGYGKRFGCSLADAEINVFFTKFFYPVLLRQDPRYFAARPGTSFWRRAQYAATRVLITRNDSGRSQFNYSEVLGNVSDASLANAYFAPSQRTFGRTMFRVGSLFATSALGSLAREFWPDIRRKLHARGTDDIESAASRVGVSRNRRSRSAATH